MGSRPPPLKFTTAGLGVSTVYCREMGYYSPATKHNKLEKTLISHTELKQSLKSSEALGSIFNLEYSPDGKIVVAAGAKNSYVLYDSWNQREIATNRDAHFECCNGITFISNSIFATFSDDRIIKIWDTRNLAKPTHVLMGHTGWIKNVECVPNQNIIVSSSFDNSVRRYDLNSPEFYLYGEELLRMPNLMRMRVAPSTGDFMIISTRGGSIYKLSNLDWGSLADDFRDNLYYVMTGLDDTRTVTDRLTTRTVDLNKISLFHKQRNTLSFLHYNYAFEESLDCDEMATSVSIHPNELCVFARQERTEERDNDDYCVQWSSIYDLKETLPEERFQMDTETFDKVEENRFVEVGRAPRFNVEVYPTIVNQVLSNGKKSRLSELSQIHGNENRAEETSPPNAPHPTRDDLYDSSFYVAESPNTLGVIKENCFHPSGLFMCSPYQNGFRIFSFNSHCDDFLSVADPDVFKYRSAPLYEMKKMFDHPGETLCVKCHPFHPQIVSGCYMGVVNWQPQEGMLF